MALKSSICHPSRRPERAPSPPNRKSSAVRPRPNASAGSPPPAGRQLLRRQAAPRRRHHRRGETYWLSLIFIGRSDLFIKSQA